MIYFFLMKVPAAAAEDKSEEEEDGEQEVRELKRAKMTLPTLASWYNNQYPKGRYTYHVLPQSFLQLPLCKQDTL